MVTCTSCGLSVLLHISVADLLFLLPNDRNSSQRSDEVKKVCMQEGLRNSGRRVITLELVSSSAFHSVGTPSQTCHPLRRVESMNQLMYFFDMKCIVFDYVFDSFNPSLQIVTVTSKKSTPVRSYLYFLACNLMTRYLNLLKVHLFCGNRIGKHFIDWRCQWVHVHIKNRNKNPSNITHAQILRIKYSSVFT